MIAKEKSRADRKIKPRNADEYDADHDQKSVESFDEWL